MIKLSNISLIDLSHSNLSTSKFENRMLILKLVNHDIGNPTFSEN